MLAGGEPPLFLTESLDLLNQFWSQRMFLDEVRRTRTEKTTVAEAAVIMGEGIQRGGTSRSI